MVALHGGEVEPFVRGHQVGGHIAASRKSQTELEEAVGVDRVLSHRRHLGTPNFEASHLSSPLPDFLSGPLFTG
ncbi:hypothetical protein D3C83_176050 [compost metagenome]